MKIWDTSCGRLLNIQPNLGRIKSICFSPAGNNLLNGSSDGSVNLWNADNGMRLMSLPHDGGVETVSFSPAGDLIATGSNNRAVRVSIFDAISGKLVLTLKEHRYRVNFICFSPTGDRIASADPYTLKLWDTGSGRLLHSLDAGGLIESMCFSPAGDHLASCSFQGVLKRWDSTGGQLLESLVPTRAHQFNVFQRVR